MPRHRAICCPVLVALCALGFAMRPRAMTQAPAKQPAEKAEALFAEKIAPLLKQRCLGCHGDDPKLRGGLDLRSRQSALKGGETGPALVPHDSKNSLLMHAVLH